MGKNGRDGDCGTIVYVTDRKRKTSTNVLVLRMNTETIGRDQTH